MKGEKKLTENIKISSFKDIIPLSGINSPCLQDYLNYFNIKSFSELNPLLIKCRNIYTQHSIDKLNPINLYGWLVRLRFEHKILPNLPVYQECKLRSWLEDKTWENNLQSKSYFQNLSALFQNFGIRLILLPYIPNSVYGAIEWEGNNPIIGIADYRKDLAICWITLFHLIGHLLLGGRKPVYQGSSCNFLPQDLFELDIDNFTARYLFNGVDLKDWLYERRKKAEKNNEKFSEVVSNLSIKRISEQFGVKPLFVIYWVRRIFNCYDNFKWQTRQISFSNTFNTITSAPNDLNRPDDKSVNELIDTFLVNIKRKMKETGTSQKELAKRLEVSTSFISLILSRRKTLSLELSIKIAFSLGLDLDNMFKQYNSLNQKESEKRFIFTFM